MKSRAAKSLARLAALAAVCAGFAFVARQVAAQDQPAATSDADRAWVQKIFPLALDRFFPIDHAEGDFIAVRSHREGLNDVPEYSFVFENTQDAHVLRAIVHEAEGASLFDQLLALHAKDPSKPYADLKPELPELKVQEWKITVAECPALAAQLTAYENIQFVRPRDDDAVAEHPILYEFHESVGGSDSEAVEYVESRAFPQWANATRRAIDSCIASAPATAAKN
ncbi:MAG TPA: hypothetical protein VHX49_07790 [Candidatus Acidoferrales bacterium]|jgi:hypothetical protein|nr:hypothetical protein [Candidatus Acidoferrales bacterium]